MRFQILIPSYYELYDLYVSIEKSAAQAGLTFVCRTGYGIIWDGTPEQFEAALATMPAWARPYANQIED